MTNKENNENENKQMTERPKEQKHTEKQQPETETKRLTLKDLGYNLQTKRTAPNRHKERDTRTDEENIHKQTKKVKQSKFKQAMKLITNKINLMKSQNLEQEIYQKQLHSFMKVCRSSRQGQPNCQPSSGSANPTLSTPGQKQGYDLENVRNKMQKAAYIRANQIQRHRPRRRKTNPNQPLRNTIIPAETEMIPKESFLL